MRKKVLFLNLTTFSKTGGIEKFNRSFLKALYDLEVSGDIYSNAHSLYDLDIDERYYPPQKYTGFRQNKIKFIFQSLFKARRYDCIILGHINLAIIGCILSLFFPKKEIILIIHGIEVWEGVNPIKKWLLERADKILSVSTFTRNKLLELQNISNNRVTIFPNTIDPFFSPSSNSDSEAIRSRYGIKESDFALFTLTRLSSKEKYKGYDIVIKCLPQVLKTYSNIRYIIAGKYDEEEKARIEKIISEMQLQHVVQLAGFIKDEEITSHYGMSDLFIMPSQKEGFGIVFIEALVCGVPVIAGNIDGSVEALRNGELGMLVNPENQDEITDAIMKSIGDRVKENHSYLYQLQQKTVAYFGFPKFKERLYNVLC